MSRAKNLAGLIEKAFTGPTWHGPSLQELLADVSAGEAAARPPAGLHSIWEQVLHVTAWVEIARRRLDGELGEPTEAENWPAVGATTPDAWSATRERLARSHHELARAVEQLDTYRLTSDLPGRNHSVAMMLRGVVEHAAYHGGQIALLKRLLRQKSREGPSSARSKV